MRDAESQAAFDADNERDWRQFMEVRNMRGRTLFKHKISFIAWMQQLNTSLKARNAGTYKDYHYKNYRSDYRNGISANSLAAYLSGKQLVK